LFIADGKKNVLAEAAFRPGLSMFVSLFSRGNAESGASNPSAPTFPNSYVHGPTCAVQFM
jgi:hypothetical protein